MNALQTFDEFLVSSSTQIPIISFIFNLVLSGVLAWFLGRIYISYGSSLSNRSYFSNNFIILTLTTMLIITIVKSSLALSLGLVGALSIIRFRAAIKEPEELAYLFISISIGLGFGANQAIITTLAFIIIILVIILLKKSNDHSLEKANLLITVSSFDNSKVDAESIINIISNNSNNCSLKRLDENHDSLELCLSAEFKNFSKLNNTSKLLKDLDKSIVITFLDNK